MGTVEEYQLDLFETYKEELSDLLQDIEEGTISLENGSFKDLEELKKSLLRHIHTIKGNSSAVGLTKASEYVHLLENQLLQSVDWVGDNISYLLLEMYDLFLKICRDEMTVEAFEKYCSYLNHVHFETERITADKEKDKQENETPEEVRISQELVPKLRDKRLFVIDDNEEVLDTYLSFFKHFEVKELEGYADPWQALNRISKGYDPDIVILDFNMPRMDGMKFAHRLRKNIPETKIILVSGHISGNDLKLYPLTTVDYYLPKPIEMEDLLEVLKKLD